MKRDSKQNKSSQKASEALWGDVRAKAKQRSPDVPNGTSRQRDLRE